MADAPGPGTRPAADLSALASLIDALLDTPPARRAERVAELSGGDPVRRAELEALVAECEEEPALLGRPAADRFAGLLDDEDAPSFPAALAERYEVREVLGRGAVATVYRARDVKHGRDVAVKVVHPEVAAALGAGRFLREIEIAARLRHPLIVPLYDSGEADGRLYYIMPYEPGLSLRDRLVGPEGTPVPLPIDEVVRVVRDVCEALAHAHAHGVVHRDVKPGNVLLAGARALVTDFGVAKAATEAIERDEHGRDEHRRDEHGRDDHTRDGNGRGAAARDTLTGDGLMIGTPSYMAPEQIAADPSVDHRADLYALGVLAYELLAGRPPFVGPTRHDVLAAHLAEAPAPVAAHRPDVPPPLAELVMACLAKRPADRPRSAADVLRRLDALVEGAGGEARAQPVRHRRRAAWLAAGVVVAAGLAAAGVLSSRDDSAASWHARWAAARIERLTDFPGDESDAAISADGRTVVFLADRDSVFDAFVTRIGSGQFVNLTGGRYPQLFNDDVRNVGFTGDGARAWVRSGDIASPARISVVPTSGGPFRPFLGSAVTAVWSRDGARLAYHAATPGDPIHVADADGANPRRVFVGRPGTHAHHLSWSPNGVWLYFAHGQPPDEMDVWRVRADGSGGAERVTTHVSRVAYPVAVDDRTVLYTATADDGTGPWLYATDVERRVPRRVSAGVEHYVSIAASAALPGQPRRLVATVSNPNVYLWSVPVTGGVAAESAATRLSLPTARAAAPRFTADSSVLYLASRGGADGLWRLTNGVASEVWRPERGAVVGAAAPSPDGGRVCFPVRRERRSTLHCLTTGDSEARPFAESLDVRGAASWSPDGRWLAVAAADSVSVRVYKVPAHGGAPVRLVDSASANPVWSPDGRFIMYTGTPSGRSVAVRGVTPDGRSFPLPPLTVDRVGESYRFLPGGRQLVVKLGGFRRQDFWLVDVATGTRRQLTRLRPGESVRRFDVSPDGTRVVFERVRHDSDIVLAELPER